LVKRLCLRLGYSLEGGILKTFSFICCSYACLFASHHGSLQIRPFNHVSAIFSVDWRLYASSMPILELYLGII